MATPPSSPSRLPAGFLQTPLKSFESPAKTPNKLNLSVSFTPSSARRKLDTPAAGRSTYNSLSIESLEQAYQAYDRAVEYLDKAYQQIAHPQMMSFYFNQAQDELYKVLDFLRKTDDCWLRSISKLEMARSSEQLHFNRYWIWEGLKDLDCYFLNTTAANELKDCKLTYLNIVNMCQDESEDIATHALLKIQECELRLQQPKTLA